MNNAECLLNREVERNQGNSGKSSKFPEIQGNQGKSKKIEGNVFCMKNIKEKAGKLTKSRDKKYLGKNKAIQLNLEMIREIVFCLHEFVF